MKTKLITEIIKAHYNDDKNFYDRVMNLVNDEELKGNIGVATEIKQTLIDCNNRRSHKAVKKDFSPSFIQDNIPIDSNNNLSLYEIVYPSVKFEDVILDEKIKLRLSEIVKERQKSKLIAKKNIRATNSLLLYGPPGCGKTLTVMALASELHLPVAYVRLDGLISSLLGETSANLRKVFSSVSNMNIVLFLDEFDSIAKKRDDSQELGELKRVVTSLLQNIDSLPNNVVLVAATNHQQLLDPAIWRRFNTIIMVDYPNFEQRKKLFELYLDKYEVNNNLDLKPLSKITDGLSCSRIEEIVLELAKKQVIDDISCITNEKAVEVFINFLSNYSSKDNYWKVIKSINDKGVSLRDISNAIHIPHTTIQYNIGGIKDE